jgi:hypothetical protein
MPQVSTRDRAALLIFALAAGIGIFWTISNVREVLSPPPLRLGEGIGAVSIGVSQFLVETALILPGLILINWLLGRAARYDPLTKRFRRTHFRLTLAYLVFVPVSVVLSILALYAGTETLYQTERVLGVIGAPFFPLQLFFAASVFAFFIRGERRNGRTHVVSQTEE